MTAIVVTMVYLAAWCPAVSDLGGDLLALMLEQPSVKLERNDFGRWQLRDHADAVYWLDADGRVMMRYVTTAADRAGDGVICIREIRGMKAERVKLMLEDRRP